MTTTRLQAAAFALIVTVATLGGMSGLANAEHREVVAAAQAATAVAVAEPAALQIVITGRRVRG
jgi:hypothetical protein